MVTQQEKNLIIQLLIYLLQKSFINFHKFPMILHMLQKSEQLPNPQPPPKLVLLSRLHVFHMTRFSKWELQKYQSILSMHVKMLSMLSFFYMKRLLQMRIAELPINLIYASETTYPC